MQKTIYKKFDFILCGILLVGLLIRLHLLVASGWGIESDEAVVGLMAKHITEGKAWPIFYYGQAYMGSLEAILTAGVFFIFGISNITLKLVPLIFSIVHILLVYLLASRFTDQFGSRIAALLTAIAPNALIVWSAKPRGGFIELVVIGTICLILATDILNSKRPRYSRLLYLGILLGLGWWVNNQIVFYMTAIGVVFVFDFLSRFKFAYSLKCAVRVMVGFFIGSAPFWYANLVMTPKFQSWQDLGKGAEADQIWHHLIGFTTEALPILLGAKRLWNFNDVFFGSSVLISLLYALVIIVSAYALVYKVKEHDGIKASSCLLLYVFILCLAGIFSASGFGWLSQEPRYLLPLYSVMFVLGGVAISQVYRKWNKAIAVGLCSAILGVNLSSTYLGGLQLPGEPFVYKNERVSRDHQKLYQWLKKNRYNHIFTNYWIGYRVAFETGEKVKFSRFMTPRTIRIKEYELRSEQENEYAPYVLVSEQASEFVQVLEARGYSYRINKVGGYVIIDHVVPAYERGDQIKIQPSQIKATHRQSWVANLVDGDLGTRWGSGSPQTPGMSVTVDLPEEVKLSGLTIDIGFWWSDAPMELFIEGQNPDGTWCVLFSTAGKKEFFAETERSLDLYFRPQNFKSLRLVETGKHPILDWSMAEITLYGAK